MSVNKAYSVQPFDGHPVLREVAVAFYDSEGYLILRHAAVCQIRDIETTREMISHHCRGFINFKKERVNWKYRVYQALDWTWKLYRRAWDNLLKFKFKFRC